VTLTTLKEGSQTLVESLQAYNGFLTHSCVYLFNPTHQKEEAEPWFTLKNITLLTTKFKQELRLTYEKVINDTNMNNNRK